jgi:hypothetical protein
MKITSEFAASFAKEWISSWNRHNLDEIMSHYSSQITFYSPVITQVGFGEEGVIENLEILQKYFSRGLELYPDLHFDFHEVLYGTNSMVIYYTSINNRKSAEMMRFDADGKIVEVRAHYSF